MSRTARRDIPEALPAGLYGITPDLLDDDDLIQRAACALPWLRLLQYRNKLADRAQKQRQAGRLLALCRAAGVPLIINDDVDLLLELDADGVHLGQEDCPGGDLAAVRQRIGPGKRLGVSCYADAGRARHAVAAGADCIAFGALFVSPTKPAALPAPLSLLTWAKAEFAPLGVNIAAIGGITLDKVARVIQAGGELPAVISDLFQAPDIAARAAAFQAAIDQASGHPAIP